MTPEQRIEKCLAYCRFLQAHGVVWTCGETGHQAVGMISGEWVVSCLSGLFDDLPDTPYLMEGCDCASCRSQLERVASDSNFSPEPYETFRCDQCGFYHCRENSHE